MPDSPANTSEAPPVRGTLSATKIVFFVVAATGPMVAMIGTVPYGFVLGTGPGIPAAYLAAGLIMLCFVSGYAALSRRIVNAGALYVYIRVALGRVPGSAAAYLAVLSYSAFGIGVFAVFGYYASVVIDAPVSWHWYTAGALLLTALLGRRQIDLSARVLGVLMVAEIAILLVMDIGIVAYKGTDAMPLVSFEPKVALGTGLGAALIFAFISFAGIESAALYGEEARDPRRSVARASFWAVVITTVFYTLTSWIVVGGVGPDNVRARAAEESGKLLFALSDQYTFSGVTTVMSVLQITSLLAACLAVHNATSRYMYALGREGLLPRVLGASHPKFNSPYRASDTQSLVAALVITTFALAGLHPYKTLGVSLVSLATVGIMVLLLSTSVAVLAFFSRNAAGRHWWRTVLAPVLTLAGLGTAIVLVLQNYPYLTGTDSVVINSLTILLPVAAAGGAVRALWLRARRPEVYHALDLDPSPPAAQPAE
ncbi:APC family permease [Streptomyces albipurpureus]|uniref:APC family permease n=1 Tax=Streptomyces albipurpureus TaxID=2897419 RepID=A0ABT0UG46_9ACTN|nr:APC family permease [Streptomyces sp. CWNU-1]MCM2387598.1 APC family permease [Streptomyces sp. CWNU-1]